MLDNSQFEKDYLKLFFMVIILGSAIIARMLIYYIERMNESRIMIKETADMYKTLFEYARDGVLIIEENKLTWLHRKILII